MKNSHIAVLSPLVLPLALSMIVFSLPLRAWQFAPLITSAVNESKLTTLAGQVHPLARAAFDQGAAPSDLPLDHMLLMLKRGPAEQSALDKFLADVQDPKSPSFHKFLTADEFGSQFGAAESDIQAVSSWLAIHGFQINQVSKGHTIIDFSGTASQVQTVFHTAIHKFTVNGEDHWANVTNPLIPAALAPAVAGFRSLHNFIAAPAHRSADLPVSFIPQAGSLLPTYNLQSGGTVMAPADFNTIYNVNGVNTLTGAGATIAVVARTNINIADVGSFRTQFGLPVNYPNVIVNGNNPGIVSSSEEVEADIDTEWSGAAAPYANIDLVISQSTSTADGADLSAEYIIDNNLADIMTESFASCESSSNPGAATFYSSLSQQAAAEGITWLVAAGDWGSPCLSNPTPPIGVSVNVIGSSPYTLTVGGTQFNENGRHSNYWNAAGSALQYIPEDVWNDDCVGTVCSAIANPFATGGGASIFFSKPSWQTGVQGIPTDGARDVPDVSLSASERYSPYAIIQEGSVEAFGGTSVSTPAFAGILALVKQKTGTRLGQATPRLYELAATQGTTGCDASNTSATIGTTCLFNDVTVGTNAVPGQATYNTNSALYNAGVGFDRTTGLGSVNVANLVNNWGTGTGGTPTANLSPTSLTFTSPAVNTASTPQNVVLTNTGNTILSIGSISVLGANISDFVDSNTCGSFLPAAASCNISVTFTPTAAGNRSATLTITDNSGAPLSSTTTYTTQTVSLIGSVAVAAAPVISNVAVSAVTTTSATITWTTNQPATSQVNYGIAGTGSSSPLSSTLVTNHSVTITGLTPATTYSYIALSTNAATVSATSATLSFTTTNVSATPPVLGYLAYWGINSSGATISWSTDVVANTQLAYGTTTALGQTTPLQTALTSSHGVVLTGLNSGTTYYFVAQSAGANGAIGYSTVYSFTTSGSPSAGAPVISNVAVSSITTTSATITWTTDQATSSIVNFGTSTAYGLASALNTNLVTAHSVTLTGLTPGTAYDFDVVSANASNVSATSANSTFSTPTVTVPAPYVGYVAFWGINDSGVTISWSTDQPADTQVAYGTTPALGQLSPLQTAVTNSHGVVLTGLNPGTTYYFVAQSTNANGATGYSTAYSFTTTGTATSQAPIITAVATTNLTTTSATISWLTDQPSSSVVNYGTTAAYGSSYTPTPNPGFVIQHSVTLTGLTAATTYNFNVVSATSNGTSTTSPNYTFTTPGGTTAPGPKISYVAFWGITSSGVIISWSTDSLANTQVAYGTTNALGQLSPVQSALTNNHGVTLTGLNSGTTYYFAAESTDAQGALGESTIYSFTTEGGTLPGISAVTITPAKSNSATATWTTSVPTYNYVQYGSAANAYNYYSAQTTLTTTPQCTLTYVPSGVIHYQLISTDASGNQTVSPDATFTEP